MNDHVCIGCGVRLEPRVGPVHRYLESSPACWHVYGLVLAREYEDPARMAAHRLTVDTYAVQHPGRPSRQAIRSVGAHLVSLHAVLELGFPHGAARALIGRCVTHVEFHWLEPPVERGRVTAADVLMAASSDEHVRAVQRWSESAWEAWSEHHARVREWARRARDA